MIIEPEFERALARASIRAITKAERYDPLRGGDQTAVQYGAMIGEIADEADLSVPQTRRRLHALQAAGKVIRDDTRGGSTAWWPVGLAETQRQPVAPPPSVPASSAPLPPRQTLTPRRQHWSDVLGMPRDCSTRDAREAFTERLAAVNELDLDAEQQRQLIRDAYNARLAEDEITE